MQSPLKTDAFAGQKHQWECHHSHFGFSQNQKIAIGLIPLAIFKLECLYNSARMFFQGK
jgi:hypothetical protein